ncbi:putative glycolipid-binding domain-containing protein [Pseudomonas sp. Gutcm_11s]|uniref:putative glycolipid-binding domain-containing protein n=1 Tax=Pseudomonas sp. Gutcm_11s TaxID=3026088 RepID=UPI00235DF37A|nr:putative glycolipid-binding domain-containing protein [Pseudomonas sp. Gutcm_11s]MDD0841369.1 putative glycolipid-binding domain-containing protein [Pseudomonas sp. Gutcm_11s]
MQHNLVWKPWTNPGVEHLGLTIAADSVTASGQLIQSIRGNSIAATYVLAYDERWRFRRLWLKVDNQGQQSLELQRDIRGNWHLNGRPRNDLTGCQQVMLSASPFTHTPLLRHAALAAGDSERFRVAHVDLLGLRVESRLQRYQCLQRHASHAVYQCDAEGHEPCELTLDEDGLLVQAIGQFIRSNRQTLRHADCA